MAGLDNDQLFSVYNWSTIICSSLLVLFFSISLYLCRNNFVPPFVKKVTILMIISNLGSIGVVFGNIRMYYDSGYSTATLLIYLFIQTISGVFRDLCFNVAHWIFAF